MTKNDVITDIYNRGVVKKLLSRYWDEDAEDLKDLESDTYVILLQLPEDLLIDLISNNKLENYISAILRRQVRSKTSYYYRKYKDFKKITTIYDEGI